MPVNETAQAALAEWLKLRGTEPGRLSLAVHRSGRIDPARTRMSTTSVFRFTKRQAERSQRRQIRPPRDLRRTLAGDMLDAGVDLSVAQKMLGHSSPRRQPGTAAATRVRRLGASAVHIPWTPSRWLAEQEPSAADEGQEKAED